MPASVTPDVPCQRGFRAGCAPRHECGKARARAAPAHLDFTPCAMLSRNHSDPIWAMKAPRRLKNVIVTMDGVGRCGRRRGAALTGDLCGGARWTGGGYAVTSSLGGMSSSI